MHDLIIPQVLSDYWVLYCTGSMRETALESIGNVCISRPEMMPKADAAIEMALSPSSSLALTKMALKTLTDLLKVSGKLTALQTRIC